MGDRIAVDVEPEEQRLGGLIRGAGRRERPDRAAVAAARAAVAAEWREVVAARARRRAVTRRWSVAAGVAIVGLAAWLAVPRPAPGVAVAVVERVSGTAEAGQEGWLVRRSPVAAGTVLATRTELRSAAGARVALRLGTASVRVDERSVVALTAPGRIELRRGALYVDNHGGPGAALVIDTPYGAVRHLGTQYETRLDGERLRVRVREGRVQIATGARSLEGSAGEQVTLAADGGVQRERIARAGGDWAWTEAIAPVYDIDDRPLLDFLHWVGRETGRDLAFASPAAQAAARDLVLRGSIAGMAPAEALAAVLITTPLQATAEDGVLRVDFRAGAR